ncbi:MAG: polysaccharide deacetylase family protein [Ignavibacteriaceae bacterium]
MNEFAVIIISSASLTKKEKKILYDYTAEGGSVICEAENARAVFKLNLKLSYIKFLYSEADNLFNNYLVCDLYNHCKIPANSNHLDDQEKTKSVFILSIGIGNLAVFPEGFTSLIHKSRTIRKNFYSEFSDQFTSERVSAVSKGIIRIHLQKAIEYLFHKRGLPFVHWWFYPDGARNIFSFRVDTDMGTVEEINSLNKLLQDYNIPATWFVETKSSQDRIESFLNLKNQEISYHCYRHKAFLSYKMNEKDIKTGLKILESKGIKPKGYAAPYGKWNKTIARLIDDFNFSYSSEFDFAYDTLPLRPFYNSSFSKALQIPVHPVSVGRLHWGGHSEENMIKYFSSIIEQKLFLDEPIIFYTHPFEKRLNVFAKVFEKIHSYNSENHISNNSLTGKIPILNFSEFAEWWNRRLDVKWYAEEKNGEILISSDNRDESVKFMAVYPSGDRFILSPNQDIKIEVDEMKNEVKLSINPYELRERTFQMIKYDILGVLRKLKQ